MPFKVTSATLDPGAALDNTMGAMLIGIIISAVLHGVTLVQAYYYFTKYKKDEHYIKILVVTTVLFDAIHLCLISHTIYHYLITQYHNEDRLRFLIWSVVMEALFTGMNGSIVQLFFTMRVWRISNKNVYLTALIVFLVFACVGSGTAWVILAMQLQTYQELLKISPLTITINALSTSVDLIIATSLCFLLHRARTGFKRTDTIITKLIIFIVNTGMLTTFCAVSSLICLVVSPHTLIYATFYFCIGRLYTNSFLATLNARKSISADMDGQIVMSVPTSVMSPSATLGSFTKPHNTGISIRVDTIKESMQADSDRKFDDRDENDNHGLRKNEAI